MSVNVGSIHYEVDAKTEGLLRAEKEVDASMRGVEKSTERADHKFNNLTASIKRATVALVSVAAAQAAIKAVTSQVAEFEQSLLTVRAVTRGTEEQMASLEKQARELGATTAFSAKQAADAQGELARMGFEVNEVLAVTPGVLKFAMAAELGLADAAKIASGTLRGMRLEVDQMPRVMDVLAATAARAGTNVMQMGESMTNAAPFAAGLGVEIEETSAALGILANSNIQGGRSGTALMSLFRQLSNITPQARKQLEAYGLSVEDLSVRTRGLANVMDSLTQSGIVVDDQAMFQVFGSEGQAAAQILMSNVAGLRDFTGELKNASGEVDKMAKILGSGLSTSMKGFGSAVSEAVLVLGRDSGFGGALQTVLDTSAGVINNLSGMTDQMGALSDEGSAQQVVIKGTADALRALAVILTGRLAAALVASTAKVVAKTAASMASAQAEMAAAQAATRRTGAELQAAKALLSTAQLEANATRGTNAHGFALTQLSAARVRATEAAGAHAAATNVATTAMTRASVAARALSGATALVGGPMGVAVIAAYGIYHFREELGLVTPEIETATDRVKRMTESLDDNSRAALENAKAMLEAERQFQSFRQATLAMDVARQQQVVSDEEEQWRRVGGQAAFGMGGESESQRKLREMRIELMDMRNAAALAGESVAELDVKLAALGSVGSNDGSGTGSGAGSADNAAKSLARDFDSVKRELETQREQIEREYLRRNEIIRNSTVTGSAEQIELLERSSDQRARQLQALTDRLAAINANGIDRINQQYDRQRQEILEISEAGSAEQIESLERNAQARQRALEAERRNELQGLVSHSEKVEAEYERQQRAIAERTKEGSAERQALVEKAERLYIEAKLRAKNDDLANIAQHNQRVRDLESEHYALMLQQMEGFSEASARKMAEIRDRTGSPMKTMADDLVGSFLNLDDTISSAFVRGMSNGESFNNILNNIGQTVVGSLLQSFIRLGVQMATNAIMGQTMQAATTKAAVSGGAAALAAWQPAAIAASIATFGAAAGVGTGAYIASQAVGVGAGFMSQVATNGYASGGYTGSGSRNEPAGIVHRGEYVMPKHIVDQPGMRDTLEAMRRGGGLDYPVNENGERETFSDSANYIINQETPCQR